MIPSDGPARRSSEYQSGDDCGAVQQLDLYHNHQFLFTSQPTLSPSGCEALSRSIAAATAAEFYDDNESQISEYTPMVENRFHLLGNIDPMPAFMTPSASDLSSPPPFPSSSPASSNTSHLPQFKRHFTSSDHLSTPSLHPSRFSIVPIAASHTSSLCDLPNLRLLPVPTPLEIASGASQASSGACQASTPPKSAQRRTPVRKSKGAKTNRRQNTSCDACRRA